MLAIMLPGCRQQSQQSELPVEPDSSRLSLLACIDPDSPCQQATLALLMDLEAEHPQTVRLTVIDMHSADGQELLETAGLGAMAIAIDGNTTVSWGEGDAQRTVTFVHPAGFAWSHDDLRAAVEAAVRGQLRPADPAEAEGIRLVNVTVRGQSIRTSDEGGEIGQLVVGDRIVLEVAEPQGQRAPGQRVSIAADALRSVLQKPFTPNQISLHDDDDGTVMMAGETWMIVATREDVGEERISHEELAERWRRELEEALVYAALQRPAPSSGPPAPTPDLPPAPETQEAPSPDEEPPLSPDEALQNPLMPPQ